MAAGSGIKSTTIGLLTLLTQNLSEISEESLERFVETLVAHYNSKVLIVGAGRSLLVGKSFALRLLHLGYQVYVLGDTLVPSISKGDLVVAISGSGSTKLVVTAVEAAKHAGATIATITSFPDSPVGKLSDVILRVKGRIIGEEEGRDYFSRQILGIHEPLAPLGTLFEDSCMILLDAMIPILMGRLGVTEEALKRRHANVE